MNYYTFQADMQDKIMQLVKPCFERQLDDRENQRELMIFFNQLSKRVQKIEATFHMQRGKHEVFDKIYDRIVDSETYLKERQVENMAVFKDLQKQIDEH